METTNAGDNLARMQSNIENRNVFLDSTPVQVHFLMIDKCNVKCVMCGGDYFRSTTGRMITLDKFKIMASNLKLENARAVVLAGAGDPLLNRDLVPIVRFINSAYPQIAISITTNGLGLTEALARPLLECSVTQVNISINSATRETYRRIMQVDGFDAVCRNARTFAELRRRSGKRVSLQFSAAINRLNIEEMPRLVELAKELGPDSFYLFYTRYYPERIRHMNVEDPADRLENDTSLFYHQELSDAMMEKTRQLAERCGIHLTHEPLFREHAQPCACTWPMTQLMVGFDGEVYPCGGSEVHFREKVEKGIYNFGNALAGPVDLFWNSEAYRALRISSRQGDDCYVPECKCCANVISPNDLRSHIMQWDLDDKAAVAPLPVAGMPLVSVIVPTYNRPAQLVHAVKSILAQTYRHVEIVVVNDNGEDVADKLVPLNTRGNIIYLRHAKNAGLAASRNTGIRASHGKYIAYLDDDDLFYPDHIETLVSFLESGENKVAYTDAYRAHQTRENGAYVTHKRDVPYSFDFDYDRILETNFVPVLCFMHARSCLDAVGFFDESLKRLEDCDLWIRMSRKYWFAHIKKLTCEFSWRVDGSTMSSGQDDSFATARAQIAGKYGHPARDAGPARPSYAEQAVAGMTSIVVLTFNQLRYTKECVESIIRHTPGPHEIVFVDNGSTDGTVSWLTKLVKKHPAYRLIRNAKNLGYARGCNQGIAAAQGEYIVLLNNDVVVTPEWLPGLLECLHSAPDIGLVGPMTNSIDGLQQVPQVGYDGIEGLNDYAARFRERNRHRRIDTSRRIIGYCMLFRRSHAERVGFLDEAFGIGSFEDDDYCLRSVLAGCRNVVAGDVFIHHYGSRSFKGNGINADAAFLRNREIFQRKWKADLQTPLGRQLAAIKAKEDARERHLRGELEKAIDLITAGIKCAPDDLSLYRQFAEMLIEAGQYESALEAIQAMSPTAQADGRIIELRGCCLEGLGRLAEARDCADQALARDPGSPRALNLKGVLAFRENNRAAAEELFRRASAADASYGEPCTNLGVILWAAGNREGGREYLERGFILSPTAPDAAERYHAAATALERLPQACMLFREAQALSPNHRRISYLLIDVLLCRELFSDAMQEIQRALVRFNDDGMLDAALAVRDRLGPKTVDGKSGRAAFTLCMVLKNRQRELPHFLQATMASVDELVIADLGSTDRTRDIARVFGARVFDAPPDAGVCAGRNIALSEAAGDWVLFLDFDEVIAPRDMPAVDAIIRRKPARPAAYRFKARTYTGKREQPDWMPNDGSYPHEEAGAGWRPSSAIRLFTRTAGVIFEGTEPGSVDASLHRLGVEPRESAVVIHDYSCIELPLPGARADRDEDSGSAGPQCPSEQSEGLPGRKAGVTSIVILTYNELKYTRECVASIIRHTPEPHEIIFVDNGSTDGTVKWLKQLTQEHSNYRLIENKKNLGFAGGCNQGIEASSGEYVLLLNNDVVVTPQWLAGMLECLRRVPDAGIVGPMTNAVSGPQKVAAPEYESVDRLDEYAVRFRERNRHRRVALRRIVGFCMLLRRSLADEVGPLDETFGTGNFEDDDFCLRAALLGRRNMIAADVFIHHYGSRSFAGNKINYRTALSGNRTYFLEKWNSVDARSDLGKRFLAMNSLERALEFRGRGDIDTAVKHLNEGLRAAPADDSLRHFLASLLIDAGQNEAALDALAAGPPSGASAETIVLTGLAKEALGRLEEAADCAEQALLLDPSPSAAWNLKGRVLLRKGDLGGAEESFRKAVEADPGNGEALSNWGALLWDEGKHAEAWDRLERGFILSPTSLGAAATYHAAVTADAAYARTELVLREAGDLHPSNRSIAFLYIDALLKLNKYDLAMTRIEQAMLRFGIEDGMLAAALEVRKSVGPHSGKKTDGLSVCMIVKNEEAHLPKCLTSIKGLADEIIVVDTGSTDRTCRIAQAFGAKVFDFFWTGNFAEARNYSLDQATGDWILVLDADEVVAPQDHGRLAALITKRASKPVAYALTTRNYIVQMQTTGWTANDGTYVQEEAGTGWFPSVKVRLFPRDKRIRFVNPVHELVEPALRACGIPSRDCDVPVHHYGKLDEKKTFAKGEEYYVLGKRKLAETGESAAALRELAIQAGNLKKFDEAVSFWQRALPLIPDKEIAYLNMASLYLQMNRFSDALAASREAVQRNPRLKEPACNNALCELYAGDVDRAVASLERVLAAEPGYASARILLAIAYLMKGDQDKGIAEFRRMRMTVTHLTEAISPFARKLIAAERQEYALTLLNAAAKQGAENEELAALRAECAAPAGAVNPAGL